MASATAGIALAAIPGVGWVASAGILLGSALIDSYVIMPAMAGKGRSAAKPPRLLDSPVGSNEPGAPRIFALGRRVRVPTHVLWQDSKTREVGGTHLKGGTSVTQQRVMIDACVAVNDRLTIALKQLHGNGKLIIGGTNLVDITTAGMTVSVSGALLVLTMIDTGEPDFGDKFAVNKVVTLAGFIRSAGADPNVGYWRVAAVTRHTSAPSSLQLAAYSGQVVAGIVATAGTAESPATVTRVDDACFSEGGATWFDASSMLRIVVQNGTAAADVFTPGDDVIVLGLSLPTYGSLDAVHWNVETIIGNEINLGPISAVISDPGSVSGGSTTNAIQVQFVTKPLFSNGVFAPTFVPSAYFHNGSETQGEDSLLAAAKVSGTVPGYRGVAYQTLPDLSGALFGDQLPYSLEAVIEVDAGMTWAQAFRVLLERAGVPSDAIDTWGIADRPFEGFFVRGAVPTLTAIQPLLVVGSIVGQERDGVIALFNIENADVVQVANGPKFSDLGCMTFGDAHVDSNVVREDTADEDLPTHVGVRHQDPDNGYADGYQSFGLRHPAGVHWQNATELDVSNVVLSRKKARDLAASTLRRAHINRRQYRFVLPMRYLDLAENDLLTVTDDDGFDIVCRVMQVDIGADLRVAVLACAEDVAIPVTGSPVQSAADVAPARLDVAPLLLAVALDIPALRNEEWTAAGLKFATCAAVGGRFAGASLWVSFDGASYEHRANLHLPAGIGELTAAAAAGTRAETYGTTAVALDAASSFAVEMSHEGPQGLQDASLVEVLAGANWCAIVDPAGTVELAAFLTATAGPGRTWTLTNLLRGLRGTSAVAHPAGARLVLLSPMHSSGVVHVDFPGQVAPRSLFVKVVPGGRGLDDVEPFEVAATWRNARPLPVRLVTKATDPVTLDVRITVAAPWCRYVRPIGATVPLPIDDLPEGYRFTIYTPDGSAVAREFDLMAPAGSPTIGDKTYTYTAADQSTDGYATGDAVWLDVRQIGAAGLGPSIKQSL